MRQLSTHVLDTTSGRPAAGVLIELFQDKKLLRSVTTNAEGRTDAPLLSDDDMKPGVYELVFHAGDYFRANGVTVSTPPFLDQVVVRFGIDPSTGKYHVPLLLSPYGYSTYRGS